MALLAEVRDDIQRSVGGSAAAERIRAGFEVAIVGPPNAGKSSLLNALAGREAAIVSARFVASEEQRLARAFPQAFAAYRQRTRRWL